MLEEQIVKGYGDLTLHDKICLVEKQLGIYLTIHDICGHLPQEIVDHLMPGRRWHRCPYCWEGRFRGQHWDDFCVRDCMELTHSRVRKNALPRWKKCWKNIWELVIPIVKNGQSVLILYAGPFRDDGDDLPEMVKKMPKFHRNFFRGIPLKSSVNSLQIMCCLRSFGMEVFYELEKYESKVDQNSANMAEIIRWYIIQNSTRKIDLASLARYLHLSKSRTGHAVRQYLGTSFNEFLRKERMNRAVNLLTMYPGISIQELTAAAGYSDPAYFMRCFSKTFGCGPRTWQKNVLKNEIQRFYP